MSLTMDDIRRIADLGRIDISDEQARIVQGELNDIFQMIERISSVDTTGIAPIPIRTTAFSVCVTTSSRKRWTAAKT